MEKTNRGYSLIELMIVVAILSIVVAWGYSSYRETMIKANRSEGLGELLIIADNMERFFSNRGTYAGAALGTGLNNVHKVSSENGYYDFDIISQTTFLFTITAAPQDGQADDSKCGTLTYGSDGTRLPANCW